MTIRARLLLLLLPPMAAFLILASFFFYFDLSKEILLIGSGAAILIVFGTVYLMADRISKPVMQLNKAALAIAAGDYEANIKVNGPKEIEELAQTLNTMSECLVEHMSRLRETSLVRERMHGEYECALILQHYMLQKVIEDFQHPNLNMRVVSAPLSSLQKGLFLLIDRENSDLSVTLLEAQEKGFGGLFKLNQCAHLPKKELHEISYAECKFSENCKKLKIRSDGLHTPLIWSIKSQQFVNGKRKEVELHNRDLVLLYDSSLIDYFGDEESIEKWMSRVLRNFAEEGLDSIQVMLANEFTFLAKKQYAKHDFKIICMQVRTGP